MITKQDKTKKKLKVVIMKEIEIMITKVTITEIIIHTSNNDNDQIHITSA